MSMRVRAEPFTIARCNSCDAQIVWAVTDSGKRMPVDAAPVVDGRLRLLHIDGQVRVRYVQDHVVVDRYRAHFATCPDAQSWRRR